ncbi:DUF962 domain-containing protein [Azospirillum brasilense]|uniref:DUF962 domain-containing protein n=1 Tax=Azospirillum brasilense TaxID=192 RepID=A0A235HGJ3_AZOBR|nr:DUF962 domain-containing protein [Azospirillum brasilense]OYD84667.1 hypothetical protein CHT98_09435 [Azospirillum brasilense]
MATDPNFWPAYLEKHRDPANRALHVAGTLSAVALLGVGLARRDWRALVAAPLVGYGAAWLGHFLVERNRPKTLDAPLASLAADVRMAGLALTGQLAREYRRYGIPDRPGLVIRRHPPSAPAPALEQAAPDETRR